MNLEESIEKAFEAGAEYVIDHSWCDEGSDMVTYPSGAEIEIACTEYINGNLESSKSTKVSHESYGGSE